jgi:hypothetical protein
MSEIENNPTPPDASAQAGVRPKPKQLETLPEFLRATKASPKSFLVFARKHPPVSLSEFDIHELGVFLDTHEKAVLRLAALLARLPDEQSVIARQVTQMAEAYARRQVPSMVWPQLRAETPSPQVKEVIRALLSAEREPQKRKKGQTSAYFVLWVARLRGALDGESLIELLLFAFPPRLKGRAKGEQVAKPDLGSLLAPLLHKKAARDIALAVAIYHIMKAADAAEASRAQTAAVERLKQEIALKEKTIISLTEQAAQNGLVLKQKDADIAQLTRDIADHRAVARQTMQRLKARLNGLLQGELLPLIRDVHDSSTMQPVRTHVILDRIETARKLIEKESQWLESLD